MRCLAIDQGNSRTKFGLFRDGDLQRAWVIDTDKAAAAVALEQAMRLHGDLPRDLRIGLCTVVPELRATWMTAAKRLGYPLLSFTGASPTPLRNAYATPETLGADRLLAAVAAAVVCAPVIPISLGTATVVDAVSADRAYLGGLIAPGIGLGARLLADAASALHTVPWGAPARAIGRATDEALAAGWFHHSLGGLQAMVRAARAELGCDAPLVLTGGWAAQIAPHLDGVARVDEHLVLRGIVATMTA